MLFEYFDVASENAEVAHIGRYMRAISASNSE